MCCSLRYSAQLWVSFSGKPQGQIDLKHIPGLNMLLGLEDSRFVICLGHLQGQPGRLARAWVAPRAVAEGRWIALCWRSNLVGEGAANHSFGPGGRARQSWLARTTGRRERAGVIGVEAGQAFDFPGQVVTQPPSQPPVKGRVASAWAASAQEVDLSASPAVRPGSAKCPDRWCPQLEPPPF
jgi:hypothetical protein